MPDDREDLELLDDWDSEAAPSRRSARWVGPLAILAVVAIVVAVVLGGTARRSTSPVTPAPTPSATPSAAASSVASAVAPAPTSATPTPLPAIAGNDPAEPLRITLLDPAPTSPGPGLVAYKVQICAQSGGVASATVRVAAANWRLATTPDLASTQPGVPDVQPQFPVETDLHKGECASGYVTFAWNIVESPAAIVYADGRFSWYWRLT